MSILNRDKILAHAKKLISQGRYDAAIKEYEKVLAVDPDDMRVKLRIAELYAKQKRVSEAIEVYQQVAAKYTSDGFYLKAITVYKSILRLNPSLVDVNQALAGLYETMGLTKDAAYQYQILSNIYEGKGDIKNALAARKRLVELSPNDIALRLKLAELYQWEGQQEESLSEYEIVAEQLKNKGEIERAMDLYEKILAHRPNDRKLFGDLVNLYRKRGDLRKALKWLESHPHLVEGDARLLSVQAEIYSRLNQIESARNKYRELADLHLSRGEMDEAMEAYKQLLVLDPDQEEDIEPLVESIRPGAMEYLREAARKRREQLAQQSRVREEMDEQHHREEIESTNSLTKASDKGRQTGFKYTAEEISEVYHRARSSHELGRLYLKSSLEAEAREELEKALELFDTILSFDATYSDVAERAGEVRGLLRGLKESEGGMRDSAKDGALTSSGGVSVSTDAQKRCDTDVENRKEKKKSKRKISFI